MKLITLILLFIFSESVFADAFTDNCLSLEGKFIGCVPSESHACHRIVAKNIEENGGGGMPYRCHYIPKPPEGEPWFKKVFRNPNAGAIALQCQTWKPEADECVGSEGGCPMSMCLVFSPPTCNEVCDLCVDNVKSYNMDFFDKGCSLLSDGGGEPACSGPGCRGRCSDEPYAGGIHHPQCLDSTGGCMAAGPMTACLDARPQCALPTFPGYPAYQTFPAEPPDPNYFSEINPPRTCSSITTCPKYVDYNEDNLGCNDNTQSCPLDNCKCVSESTPRTCVVAGAPGLTNDCPAGSTPVLTVQPMRPVPDVSQCPTRDREEQVGAAGASCPWVAPFGAIRQECGPVPCCCQFDPVTKTSKTSAQCAGEADPTERDCSGGCQGYLERKNCNSQNPQNCVTGGSSTVSAVGGISEKSKPKGSARGIEKRSERNQKK